MKQCTFFIKALLLLALPLLSFSNNPEKQKQQVSIAQGEKMMQKHSTAFLENKGQIKQTDGADAPYVSHVLQRGNTNIYLLKEGGIAYQFNKLHYPEGYEELMLADRDGDIESMERMMELEKDIRLETYRMDMHLKDANPNAKIITEGKSADYINYYNHDALSVHHYQKVTYKDIYPGIDWVVYTNETGFKYDFVVHPGADPAQIQLAFTNQEELYIDDKGNLIHSNHMGSFLEKAPVSFQEDKTIKTRFVLKENILRFDLGEFNSKQTLTIDPARIWATYYGGIDVEGGRSACTVDGSDNVYLTGSTQSNNAIALGGHQNIYGGGTYDAFLVKFNSIGIRQWATYYGGDQWESSLSCTVDGNDNVYLVGYSGSSTGIASNGHQNTHSNPGYGPINKDAFLVKFNSSGVRQWGTYYGGSNEDWGWSCIADANDNVYLTGTTESTDNIASGGHQNTYNGDKDAFLVKFNSSGVRQWGTYYGGNYIDSGIDCATDNNGNVYLSGTTGSGTDIAFNGHQNVHDNPGDGAGGINNNAYLVKFNSSGIRQWATYYGGSEPDGGNSCVVDSSGNIYLAGRTSSSYNIATSGHQNTYNGNSDAFLAKFNSSGILQWGTYYGGNEGDNGQSCVLDRVGNIYLAGFTSSNTSIASGGYKNTQSGLNDVFLVKFNNSGIRQWGTYYGDTYEERGWAASVDNYNNIYLSGYTSSTASIASGGHQNNYGGGSSDAFLIKFGDCGASTNRISESVCDSFIYSGQAYTTPGTYIIDTFTNVTGCDSFIILDLIVNSNAGLDSITTCDSITWIDGNTYTSNNNTATHILTNAAGCDSIVALNLTINNSTTGTDTITACDSVIWINGNTYTSSNNTATYTLSNSAGCDSVVTLDLTINNSTSGTDVITSCDSHTWIDGNTYTTSNNTATFILTNTSGCDSIVTLDLTINNTSSSTDIVSACDSTTWIDGNTYNSSNNTAIHTLTNAAGCDSIITLNLTINNSTTGTDIISTCDSITWIDGNTYTSNNNTASYTLTNNAGCDSVVTLDLTVNSPTAETLTETACNSFTLNGQTYTASNTYTQTLVNNAGCDSLLTLNLTINNFENNDLSVNATAISTCNANDGSITLTTSGGSAPFTYNWSNGVTTQNNDSLSSGSYSVTVTDVNNCTATASASVAASTDSLPTALFTYTQSDSGLFFKNLSSAYDAFLWDFGDGNTSDSEVNPAYSFSEPGTYIVCLSTYNSCGMDSMCAVFEILGTSIKQELEKDIVVYPNPTDRHVYIRLPIGTSTIRLYSMEGKLMAQKEEISNNAVFDLSKFNNGVYFVNIIHKEISIQRKIVKF